MSAQSFSSNCIRWMHGAATARREGPVSALTDQSATEQPSSSLSRAVGVIGGTEARLQGSLLPDHFARSGTVVNAVALKPFRILAL